MFADYGSSSMVYCHCVGMQQTVRYALTQLWGMNKTVRLAQRALLCGVHLGTNHICVRGSGVQFKMHP